MSKDPLLELPCCRPFRITPILSRMGIQYCSIVSKVDDPADDGHEIALVSQDGRWTEEQSRGVASLRLDEEEPTIEWTETRPALIAAYGRALARVGWRGCSTLGEEVYGGAS